MFHTDKIIVIAGFETAKLSIRGSISFNPLSVDSVEDVTLDMFKGYNISNFEIIKNMCRINIKGMLTIIAHSKKSVEAAIELAQLNYFKNRI